MSSPIPPSETVESQRSLGELIGDITTDLSTLMRQELELAKAELTQTAKDAGKGAGMFGGAGYAGHMTILFLSFSLWWGLGTVTGYGWSALIVAAIWAVIALVLFLTGKKEFAQVRGLRRTADTVKKIPNAVKGDEELNRR